MSGVRHDIFLSIVTVVRCDPARLEGLIRSVQGVTLGLVRDFELVLVDPGQVPDVWATIEQAVKRLPKLQAYLLPGATSDFDALVAGLERALGDAVVVMDLRTDDPEQLPALIQHLGAADVVYGQNEYAEKRPLLFELLARSFHVFYRAMNGVHLAKEAPFFRALDRQVVKFILEQPQPAVAYRMLPLLACFRRGEVRYQRAPLWQPERSIATSMDRALSLLVMTGVRPLRLAVGLSLFGAVANLLYSGYVFAVWLFKPDVAAGWVTLSLQLSGMFFLFSVVLLFMAEYLGTLIQATRLPRTGFVTRELTSPAFVEQDRLNVEKAH